MRVQSFLPLLALFFAIGIVNEAFAAATFSGSYAAIDYPAYVKHGQFRDTGFTITNAGDQPLTYSVAVFETTGQVGWLSANGFSGSVDTGVFNTGTGNFRLNVSGMINTPGTIQLFSGGAVFTSNAPSSPDTIPITVHICDSVIYPRWDSLYVSSASKAVNRKGQTISNNGGMGDNGFGGVNLDFSGWDDCDPTADVYLREGSAVVGWVSGTDTNIYYNMLGSGWLSETGLRPIKGPKKTTLKSCTIFGYSLAYSGRFTTADSNVTMEKAWYAPILSGTGTNDSAWMIEALKVYNTSGSTITNFTIGEIADWNVPSDSMNQNSSGFNPIKNLIYQQGVEFVDAGECQDNNTRFGGIRYLSGFKNATAITAPSGAFTRNLSADTITTGNFDKTVLRSNMQQTGYVAASGASDQYSVMTFRRNETLTTTDTLRFYTAWLTIRNGDTTSLFTMADKALSWFSNKGIAYAPDTSCLIACCCVKMGDFDHSGSISVVDITKLVAYLFQGGVIYTCKDEADYNHDWTVNVVDLTLLVARLYGGGPFVSCPC